MQGISLLLAVGVDDDLDVTGLGEVRKLILGPERGASGVRTSGAMSAGGGASRCDGSWSAGGQRLICGRGVGYHRR